MTEDFFFASNPVFSVDGNAVPELTRDLIRLDVADTVSGLKSLQARFQAIGPVPNGETESLLYLDGQHVDFGQSLEVSIGPPSNQQIIFKGSISSLQIQFEESQEPEFKLCAEDALMDFRMTRRCATYENLSDADVALEIANHHGLESDIDVEGPTYDRLQQLNMSDLAFLRDRARLLQAELWVKDNALNFKTRDRRESNAITLYRGNDLIAVKASADLAHQRTGVRCSGFDANDRTFFDELADESSISGDMGEGKSGVSILAQAFGDRISHRVREVPLDASEATEWARAELLRRARSFVKVNAMSRGTPEMMVGSLLSLQELGTPFSGDNYYVTQVHHSFDLTEGHRTHFEAERPTLSEPT